MIYWNDTQIITTTHTLLTLRKDQRMDMYRYKDKTYI